MSEDARTENVETAGLEAQLRNAITNAVRFSSAAPGSWEWDDKAARAVLPIVEAHAKAERKAGAVDALREAEGDIRAALRDLRRRRER